MDFNATTYIKVNSKEKENTVFYLIAKNDVSFNFHAKHLEALQMKDFELKEMQVRHRQKVNELPKFSFGEVQALIYSAMTLL